MNLAACVALTTRPENKTWFRAIQPQFWNTALATAHTKRIPGRYSPATSLRPAFSVLYLAEDPVVALFEVGALLGSPYGQYVPSPHSPWITLNVQVTLQSVADLTDAGEQNLLATTAQELTGDWRGYLMRSPATSVHGPTGLAPTQLLGAALRAVPGLEGFRTVSAKIPTQMNLVVFRDKLQPNSQIQFTHLPTGKKATIRPRKKGK